MPLPPIIDSLCFLPKKNVVAHCEDCRPFADDLSLRLGAGGMAAAVLADGHCSGCHHHWRCADRRNQEVAEAVARNPSLLRGLGAFDQLRIGESLRWIEESIAHGHLSGVYVEAVGAVRGLDAARMYPVYGLCAMLRAPVAIDLTCTECWSHHASQIEVVAADFPDLQILLPLPADIGGESAVAPLRRFPGLRLLLSPAQLQHDLPLCEFLEGEGRQRLLFRSAAMGWSQAAGSAGRLELSPDALEAYLCGNAARLFSFSAPLAAAGDAGRLRCQHC